MLKKSEYSVEFKRLDSDDISLIALHHYSNICPRIYKYATVLRLNSTGDIKGYCVLLQGMKGHGNYYKRFGIEITDDQILNLSRLVILPDMPQNSCSFLLGRTLRLLKSTPYRLVETFADTHQNHTGAIYKASNFKYCELRRTTHVVRDGKMMTTRRGNQGETIKGFKHKFYYLI